MSGYAEAVQGWTAHLRGGGTTPWSVWRQEGATDQTTPLSVDQSRDLERSRGLPLPSATHLELVRRINQEASGDPVPGLVDLVLTTAAPGRGRVDVPLSWPGDQDSPRFGTPPVEPDEVPGDELVRLAVGVLARQLPLLPPPAPAPDLTRWPAPWRRRFRLYGSPGTVAGVRSALLAQGMVESDWRPVHIVLGRPLEVMMAEHWAATTAQGGHLRWTTLWRRAEVNKALPPRLDVVGISERLAARRRARDPVHLVVAREPDEVAAEVAGVLRTRAFDLGAGGDAARTDLLRRLNRLTTLTRGPGQVRRLATTLSELLSDSSPRVPALDVPAGTRKWARRSAAAAVERLDRDTRGAGYAVHGDPGSLAPIGSGLPGTIDPRQTLEVAVEACLRTWRRQEGLT
jgi:hypothetical protein